MFTEKEMTAYAKAGGVAEEAMFNMKIVTAFQGQDKESARSVNVYMFITSQLSHTWYNKMHWS